MVKKYAEKYRLSNPEWFKKYRHSRKPQLEHLHPELAKEIREYFAKVEKAPDGWLVAFPLSNILGASNITVQKLAEKFRQEHPEWFRKYQNEKGYLLEHYSPELVKIITKKYKEVEPAPPGWITIGSLAKSIETNFAGAQKRVEKYREKYPEWLKTYQDKRKQKCEFISPELVEIIQKKEKEILLAPKDWLPPYQVHKNLNIATATIKIATEKYRLSNSEWFKVYKSESGQKTLHYSPQLIKILEKKFQKNEKVTERWFSVPQLSKDMNINPKTIRDYVMPYKEKHPEWFELHREKSAMQVEFFHPDLVKLIRDNFKEHIPAPSGWNIITSLARKVGIHPNTLQKKLKIHKASHPSWFNNYKDKNGIVREYYSPELISIIKKDLPSKKRAESAPSGWLTASALAKNIGITDFMVRKYAEKYKLPKPEWFKKYKDQRGSKREHYSPELIKSIKDNFESAINIESAPKGWLVKSTLADRIRVSHRSLEKYVKKYRATNPEWFREYRDHINTMREHYSPELIKVLEKDIKREENKLAPDGWVVHTSLARSARIDIETLTKYIKEHKVTNPEWFKQYRDKSGNLRKHYSPELVKIVKDTFLLKEDKTAPNDWLMNSPLARSVGINVDKLKKYVKKYRSTNPEWFKEHRNKIGQIREYYSPELVKVIRDNYPLELAPNGWVLKTPLARNLKITFKTLEKYAEKYRADHPEWFKQYRDKKNYLREHYSPELVKIIKNKFGGK